MFLHNIVKRIKPEFVLELGTKHACSTIHMALGLNNGKIISIDDYKHTNMEILNDSIAKCNIIDKIFLIQGTTFEAGNLVRQRIGPHASPEIVFMDASHIDSNLQTEFDSIKSILPANHMIIIDDAYFNDIANFIARMAKQYEISMMLNMHDGLAILCNYLYIENVSNSVKDTINAN